MDSAFIAFGGFLLGLALTTRVVRWIGLLVSGFTNRSKLHAKQSGATVVLPVLLHSGLWALLLVMCLTYYVLSRPHDSWWWWLLGGLWTAPVLLATVAALTRRRNQKRNASTAKALVPGSPRDIPSVTTLSLIFGIPLTLFALLIVGPGVLTLWSGLAIVFLTFLGAFVWALIMRSFASSWVAAHETKRQRAERAERQSEPTQLRD
jgi:hypothetical protein